MPDFLQKEEPISFSMEFLVGFSRDQTRKHLWKTEVISGVSNYSGMTRSRSAASIAGRPKKQRDRDHGVFESFVRGFDLSMECAFVYQYVSIAL